MAVRKIAYTAPYTVEKELESPPQPKVKQSAKTMKLVDALPIMLTLLMIVGISSLIISRYAYINRLQLDIFDKSQIVKQYQEDVHRLTVERESFMTINEIQAYANDELGMILPTEKNKVAIKTSDYYILDKNVAFKGSDALSVAVTNSENIQASK